MAQAVAAVVSAIVKVGTAVVTAYKAHAVVRALVLVAAMVGSHALSRAAAKPSQGRIAQGVEIKLKVDPTMPRQIPVGRTATGGSWVFAFTWTDDTKVPNKYLTRITSISDFPIHGLVAVWEGNETLEWSGDPHAGEVSCTSHHLTKDGSPAMWLRFYRGSFTPTADAQTVSRSNGKWTNEHVGVGQAYAITTFMYDGDAFPNGEPTIFYEIDGAKVYDDRLDDSKGGSSNQRLNLPGTWTYSDNTAVVTAQLLRGFYINGQLVLGGQCEERDLDYDMLVAAYSTCDQMVEAGDGTDVKRYRCGCMLTASDTVSDMLDDLSLAMDGTIYDRGGSISILPGGTRTPVVHITDDDIVWTEEKSWQPKVDLSNLYNNLVGTYVSASDAYNEKPFPPLVSTLWEEEDGGERLPKTLSYRAVPYATQVQRTNTRIWKQSRYQGTVAFVVPTTFYLELEQGDWFTQSSARWDFEDKYFEVVSITLTPEFRTAIVGKEVSPVIDGWDPVTEEQGSTDDYYGQPGNALIVPVLEVSSVEVAKDDESFVIPAVQVEVLNIVEISNASFVDYEIAFFIGETLTNAQRLPTRSADEHIFTVSENIIPGYTYAVRARTTDGKRFSAWSTWYTTDATNRYIVPDTRRFGGYTPDEWHTIIEDISGAGENVAQTLADLAAGVEFNAQAILAHVVRNVEDRERFEALTHMPDGVEVWAFAASEQEQRITADEAFQFVLNMIGAMKPDQSAFVFNASTAWVNDEMSLGEYVEAVSSRFDDSEATFQSTVTALTTDISALASFDQLLGAKNLAGTAIILNSSSVQVTPGVTLGQWRTGIVTEAVTSANTYAQGIFATEVTNRIQGDNVSLSYITTLQTQVNGQQSSITQLFSANSQLGLRWGITVNNNGKINGIVLNSGAGGAAFIVDMDYFAVINTLGTISVAPFVVFAGQVHMTDVVVHTLAAGTVTADKIVGGAVSNLYAYDNGPNIGLGVGAQQTVTSLGPYVYDGGKMVIFVDSTVASTAPGQSGVRARLFRNGVQVGGERAFMCPPSFQVTGAFKWYDNPGPGTYQYTVTLELTGGSSLPVTNISNSIIAMELKK